MASTLIYQQQLRGTVSASIDDDVPIGDIAGPNTVIEADLNAIRSQLKRILGTSAWSDAAPTTLQAVKASAKGKYTGADVVGGVLNFSGLATLQAGYSAVSDVDVYLNGLLLTSPNDYAVPSTTTVSFVASIASTAKITLILRNVV